MSKGSMPRLVGEATAGSVENMPPVYQKIWKALVDDVTNNRMGTELPRRALMMLNDPDVGMVRIATAHPLIVGEVEINYIDHADFAGFCSTFFAQMQAKRLKELEAANAGGGPKIQS